MSNLGDTKPFVYVDCDSSPAIVLDKHYIDCLADGILPDGWYLVELSSTDIQHAKKCFELENISIQRNPMIELGFLLKNVSTYTKVTQTLLKWIITSTIVDALNLVDKYRYLGDISEEQAIEFIAFRSVLLHLVAEHQILAVPEKLCPRD